LEKENIRDCMLKEIIMKGRQFSVGYIPTFYAARLYTVKQKGKKVKLSL
jgi:hypothetical protein